MGNASTTNATGECNEDVNNYFGNTLDGITWNGKKEENRSFIVCFTEVLKTCYLTGRAKLIIKQRFLGLYRHYFYKQRQISMCYITSRTIITVGSILIPSLLTLDTEISDRSQTSQVIYYIVFTISLLVTLANTVSELFNLNKKYITYTTTKYCLSHEGWLFLELVGKYSEFSEHSECWRVFLTNIEMINKVAVTSSLLINSEKTHDENNRPSFDLEETIPLDTNDTEQIIYSLH